MIPIRLELKNFMAYRDSDPLDLSGLHTVVLTGENGAGKSTILDGITFALWGQARARSDDALISQEEQEMRVALTFREGPNTYQVVRTRKLGRATGRARQPLSSGSVDLFIGESGTWRSLSEPRQRETDARIQALLNLSYDTFINSAYLKQGRADEFAIKTPAERKTLLAEILSLDTWQVYDTRAKTRADKLEEAERIKRAECAVQEAELLRLPEYERELQLIASAQTEMELQFEHLQDQHTRMEKLRERWTQVHRQITQTHERITVAAGEQNRMAARLSTHIATRTDFENARSDRARIEQGYMDLERTRALNDELNLKVSSLVSLNARKTAAENSIAQQRQSVERARDEADRVVERLSAVADSLRERPALADMLAVENVLSALATERDQSLIEISDIRESLAANNEQNRQLKREMLVIKSRMEALRSAGAVCDSCGRELDEPSRARLLAEMQTAGKQLGDSHRGNDDAIASGQERRQRLEIRIREIDGRLVGRSKLQRDSSAAQVRVMAAEQAMLELPSAQEVLAGRQRILDAADYAHEAQAQLAGVHAELANLGYDGAEHSKIRDQIIPSLQPFAMLKSRLDRAEFGLVQEQGNIDALEAQLRRQGELISIEHAGLVTLKNEVAEIELARVNESAIATDLARIRTDLFTISRKVGAAHQRVNACHALKSTLELARDDLRQLERDRALIKELREAFGRNGVPAMIIEVVLPEIEATANALLARMNGRMRVHFETQRLNKSNEVTETLEIRIEDELGERPYEMFSGGEAFRINFAIRIALSKLLAHRQGAKLQTLFIDEGFGTQDAQGREKLIEAIRVIEPDFERIFVITHIEELKDAFPARIEVIKTQKGSYARIV